MKQCLLVLLCVAALGLSGAEARARSGALPPGRTNSAPAPAAPPLTVQVEPTDVTLERGRGQALIVVAHNPRAVLIDHAHLDLLAPDGVAAVIEEQPAIPGTADLIWRITLTENELAPQVAKIVAKLDYSAKGIVQRVDLATVTVTQAPPVDLAASLKALVLSGEMSLDEYNDQPIVLDFHNNGRETITVGDYEVLAPAAYVRLAASLPPMAVKPGEDKSVKLTLQTAQSRIMPGKYTLVLGYSVSAQDRSTRVERATVQSPITLSVPGVTDVMQLFGVPSLLLLPGALTVVAFIATFSRFYSVAKFDWKDPQSILIAISISIFYPVIYPAAIKIFDRSKAPDVSYLHGYNVDSAIMLWFGSCVLGVVGGIVGGLLLQANSAWRRWLIDPDGRDRPMDVLRKLAYHGVDFNFDRLRRRSDGTGAEHDPDIRLVLPFGDAGDGRRWVVKRVFAQRPPRADERRAKAIVDLLGRKPASRWVTLRLYFETWKAVHFDGWTLDWQLGGAPIAAASSDYEELGEQDTFLMCK